MLHNPLILILFQSFLRTVIFTAFITYSITSSFHNPVLLFFCVICDTSILTSTVPPHLQQAVSVVFLWSCCYLFLPHICERAPIQSFLSAQVPPSSAAVPASVQSKWLSLKQKISSFHHCLARKMLFCKSASVCRSCMLWWKMLLHLWIVTS